MNSKAPGGKCKRDADTGRQAREDFPKDGMVELQTEGQEKSNQVQRKGRRNGMCQDPVAPPESRVRYNGMATAEIWVA